MKDCEYLMVTYWDDHWDQLQRFNNSTLFTLPFIKDNIALNKLPGDAKTIFVKTNKDNKHQIEGCWTGLAQNFRIDKYKGKKAIRFEVSKLQTITFPSELSNISEGWHLNPLASIAKLEIQKNYCPPFFSDMNVCGHLDFELHCFRLLRLIGIHDIHKNPIHRSAGKADGFFKFGNLSVIYDATLENNFEEIKDQQIENYINQLKKEKITFDKISYTIKGSQCQVWIITRGPRVRTLREEDHILVKEIPFTELVRIYGDRLTNEIIGEGKLGDRLRDFQ
jgi:hypothetical protein